MKALLALLLVIFALLQYRLWFGDGSFIKVWQLKQAIVEQQNENQQLGERNRALEAEVRDLKEGVAAIEERARTELGMIRDGETFYQVVEE
jgi:cell division protein FtsB